MWFSGVAEAENPGLEELQGFVRATMSFLNFVLQTPEFGFLWENDRDLFGLAFETFNTDVLHSAENLIAVVPFIPQPALNVHGLVGRPMRFKLRVVDSIGNQSGNSVWRGGFHNHRLDAQGLGHVLAIGDIIAVRLILRVAKSGWRAVEHYAATQLLALNNRV